MAIVTEDEYKNLKIFKSIKKNYQLLLINTNCWFKL